MDQEQIKNLEKELWRAADNLRANSKLTAAEYKDPVLGLILLRFAQNRFDEVSQKIIANLPVNYNTEREIKITKDHEEFRKKEKENYGHDIGPTKHEKINTLIYNITYYDEKFIKAERYEMSSMDIESEEKINLNLKDGSIKRDFLNKYQGRSIVNESVLFKCKISKSSSKSNLLDYWWAVILIIAITFFVFTQSGKRLKQIRRK